MRSRRPRSVPPSSGGQRSLPPFLRVTEDIPRFRGASAPLAALAAQVRGAASPSEKANSAGRLARQLVKRNIELREAIGLAEKSLALSPDVELTLDLAGWWVDTGDVIRGAALAKSAAADLAEDRRTEALLLVIRLYARAGQIPQVTQAIRQAMNAAPRDPRPHELHGSLGFWTDISPADCAQSYLNAAALRERRGEEAAALEALLRAFEVAPSYLPAAEALSEVLRARGRPGAADEIFREHLRRGSAAQRAAHHERVFGQALARGDARRALESAFEADLDVELDPERLETALSIDDGSLAIDFESFLVWLSRSGVLGGADQLGRWLIALMDAHLFDWGEERLRQLRALAFEKLGLVPTPFALDLSRDSSLRDLRQLLGSPTSEEQRKKVRPEIALRECSRGAWGDAFEVIQPLLSGEEELDLGAAALALIVAGRARNPSGRAHALHRLAAVLPPPAAAVADAVASEMLLALGHVQEAQAAAENAVSREPESERALASRALVALSSPVTAGAGLLEQSLSVLVARADACALLCRSAEERGQHRLALTWAARALALRPGDLETTRQYLAQAVRAEDTEKLVEALGAVLQEAAPIAPLASDIADVLGRLGDLSADDAEQIGNQVLAATGVRSIQVLDALFELAKSTSSPKLLAAITERRLVASDRSERASLSLTLARQRMSAEQPMAAARALRRALAQGADPALVSECLQDIDPDVEADGALAVLEIQAELAEAGEGEESLERRAEALRRVGAARWDLAQDQVGAVHLWLKAADLKPEGGLELFAHYLHEMAGPEVAADLLKEAASQTEDATRSGRLLGFAARELFESDNKQEAFALASQALRRAPLLTEILSIAEGCASPEQSGELLALYDLLAEASLGHFGERAVHYRAARKLEERGLSEEALLHACAAFEAVPAEGVAFVLMARLAESTAGHAHLVTSLQKVADSAANDGERARWLAKAADLADTESVGRKQRVDILLRAAQMLPEQETITSLLDALAHFLADEPDALDEMWGKFEKLSEDCLRHASGAHGAQMCLMFGVAGLSHFDKPKFAFVRLRQALSLDIEVPDYENLCAFATQLAGVAEEAANFVDRVKVHAEERRFPIGRGLSVLAAALSELLGDVSSAAELLVHAAGDFPEDVDLVSRARKAASQAERPDLLEQVESLLPVVERARTLLTRLGGMSEEEGLDALLDLELEAAPDELRARLLCEIAERQEVLGRFASAAESFRALYALEPDNPIALKGVERDADRTGNDEELARVLKARENLCTDPIEARVLTLRRAAVLETRLGRAKEARDVLAKLVAETDDRAALRMLADSWERTGDSAEAAEHWIRVKDIAIDEAEADEAAYRAAVCLVDSGVPRRASEILRQQKRPSLVHRRLALELARELGDAAEIRRQLVGLAEASVGDGKEVGELYLEAAFLALEAKDDDQAEQCALRAKGVLPTSREARLLAARLGQKRSPVRTAAEAETLLADLSELDDLKSPTDREIIVYLKSQALVVRGPKDDARLLLEEAVDEQGQRGLLCVALAELIDDDHERAISLLESAVGSELFGFRTPGEVLLLAGAAARKLGDLNRARGFVSAVADDDPSRARAARELEEISLEQVRAQREVQEEEARARKEEKKRVEAEEAQVKEAAVAKKRAEEETAEKRAQEKAAAARAAQIAEIRRQEKEEREAQQREAVRRNAEEVAAAGSPSQAREHGAALVEERMKNSRVRDPRRDSTDPPAASAVEMNPPAVPVSVRNKSHAEIEKERAAIRRAARSEHEKAARAVSEHAELAPPGKQRSVSPSRKGAPQPSEPPLPLKGAMVMGIGSPKVPDLSEELELVPSVPPPQLDDPGDFELVPSIPPPGPTGTSRLLANLDSLPDDLMVPAQSSRRPASRPAPAVRPTPQPRSRSVSRPPQTSRSEDVLVGALEQGDILAGRELLDRMLGARARARDAVVVAQHLTALDPGDAGLLGLLVTAAARDGNDALALSVRHVLGAYGRGELVPPPDPETLAEHGDAARSLMTQGGNGALHEALALVWDHSQKLYKKDLSEYGVSGVERVPLHAPTPLGHLYRSTARLLGMQKTPVFRLPGQEEITMQVALLAPPATVISGDILQSSPELAFHFGAMLAAASPEHALLYGLPPEEVQNILQALALSFGSGGGEGRPDPEVTRTASFFWEAFPVRAQRRLSQICAENDLSYVELADSSRRILRRAGLLVCGDLPTAVGIACAEVGRTPPVTLEELADVARDLESVADLVGLALSPEYAELRYRTA